MARWFSIWPGLTFKGRQFKGLRGWAGKPAHPPLTDFPIVAYVLAATFDLISYIRGEGNSVARDFFVSATHVMIAGAIVSLLTALTGFWDWLKSTPNHTQVWRTANWHMAVMLTVTAIVIIDIIVRLAQWEGGYATLGVLVLSLIAAVLVSFGATYGGSLVYDYEFNVEQTYGGVWEESERDIYPGETLPRE